MRSQIRIGWLDTIWNRSEKPEREFSQTKNAGLAAAVKMKNRAIKAGNGHIKGLSVERARDWEYFNSSVVHLS